MTEDEIYTQMLDVFQQKTGYEMNGEADLAVRLHAAAAQIMSLYSYADYVYRQAFPQTAQEEALDRHGILRGVARLEAQKASGKVTFGISAPLTVALNIPQGTVCLSDDGTGFETTKSAVLKAGKTSVNVSAQAVETGPAGNVVAGAITRMQTPPDGIETVTNGKAFTGGRDAEGDEAYRERILAAYAGLSNGANIAYYQQLALSVEGIDRAEVISCPDGIGTVKVLVASDSGTVSEDAVQELKTLLNSRMELGITVTVATPTSVEVAVAAKLLPADGYTLAQAKLAVEAAITDLIQKCKMGKNLYLAQIIRKAMETGTIDNITLTAPTGDVTVESTQQLTLGSITLEGM